VDDGRGDPGVREPVDASSQRAAENSDDRIADTPR
jgi:hypothetical protein